MAQISVNDLTFYYEGSPDNIFEHVSFSIDTNWKLGFVGRNGKGKTTFLNQVAAGLVVSYINQDTSFLHGSIRDLCINRNLDESYFCALLRQLGMERTQFTKEMQDFSEGQKKKVLIASSLLTPAHLYIWDEPLNYIDVFSRIQIENLFEKFRPTMLIVEHDARFRDKIATKVIDM